MGGDENKTFYFGMALVIDFDLLDRITSQYLFIGHAFLTNLYTFQYIAILIVFIGLFQMAVNNALSFSNHEIRYF